MATILLAVTGMTPQVITETLYGMARTGEPWPERIEIITTRIGADKVYAGLIEQGHLARLCDELGRPRLEGEALKINVVPGEDGTPVNDARTLPDHEALADFITERVRQLTADDANQLHASIAGGRKTMTFYLGYAMSLFGRAQDRMSHVLVSEGYESHPEFYFPTRESQIIHDREGQPLDMHQAEVSLADIPFVRQRDQLPAVLRDLGESIHFRTLVELINLGLRPEAIRLHLFDADMRLEIHDDRQCLSTLTVANRFDWSWYWVVADFTRRGDGSLRRDAKGDGSEYLGRQLMQRLAHSLGLPFSPDAGYREQVEQWCEKYETELERAGVRPGNFHRNMADGLNASRIMTRLRESIVEVVPKLLAERLIIRQLFDVDGRHLGQHSKFTGYGLNLAPTQIILHED